MTALLRRAFVAASIAWALLLVLVPFLASRPHGSASGAAIVAAVYGIGALVCHQLPARSYRLWTAQMPVCARCTGIYAGAAVSALAAIARDARLKPSRYVRAVRIALAAAALPTAFTLVYEWSTGVTPSNTLRFAAGVPIGVVVPF